MTPFNLKIITPDRVFFDGQTENVIVRTTVGDKGVLANHEPYAAALPTGRLRVMAENGNYRHAAISSGTIKVAKGGDTVILAQSCEWADEIDVERAAVAQKAAEEKMAALKEEDKEFEVAEFKLKRALNRLDIAER